MGAAVLRRTPRLVMTWHYSPTVSCSGDGGGPWGDGVEHSLATHL